MLCSPENVRTLFSGVLCTPELRFLRARACGERRNVMIGPASSNSVSYSRYHFMFIRSSQRHIPHLRPAARKNPTVESVGQSASPGVILQHLRARIAHSMQHEFVSEDGWLSACFGSDSSHQPCQPCVLRLLHHNSLGNHLPAS